MTPEERSLLERTHELAKENNELLRNLKRRARLSNVMKILYWVVIIGISLGAFYFIQPYVDMVRGLTGGSSTKENNSNSYAQQIKDLLN